MGFLCWCSQTENALWNHQIWKAAKTSNLPTFGLKTNQNKTKQITHTPNKQTNKTKSPTRTTKPKKQTKPNDNKPISLNAFSWSFHTCPEWSKWEKNNIFLLLTAHLDLEPTQNNTQNWSTFCVSLILWEYLIYHTSI